MQTWHLLDSGENSPEYNMALDEALLDFAFKSKIPTLRFYKWKPPTLSIGYFQKIHDSVNFRELKKRGFGFVRRLTGGRAVLHDKEITYSITIPSGHKLLELSIINSYELLCKPIIVALKNSGITAYLSSVDEKEVNSPSCFASPTFKDIKVKGKKLVGSAQARNKEGLLQHGSILIDVDIEEIFTVLNVNEDRERLIEKGERRITSLRKEGFEKSEEELKAELVKAFSATFEINFRPLKISSIGSFNKYILKYSSKEWNYRI